MANLTEHDLKQMDEAWQGQQPEPVVRALLTRTLDELRVARDRLNQNSTNSSRPSGSMPPWQGADGKAKDNPEAVAAQQDSQDDEDDVPGDHAKSNQAKDAEPTHEAGVAQASLAAEVVPVASTPKRAGRALGASGHGRTQELLPTKFEYKYPEICAGCQHHFNPDDPAQAWTAWDTLELHPVGTQGTSVHQLGLYIEVTRHFLMHRLCECAHTTRAVAWRAQDDSLWQEVDIGQQRLLGPRLAATVVYLSLRMRLPRRKVQELLLELFGLELSTALIDQTIKQAARQC